ncbi:sodium-dependent transporter [Candidatus Woesearchaeota archaeon]|jgi:neurotransmitter:Na+ symporter, NSS family|nr:sodium-dependent transporter [Candidatus Woesearchaeota archaeon]MBT3537698.1 sodium-dependent transporter [Candidatus Woesearchaeota archaeon]MBT4697829.1 sodium-dependent transporter [Candidatus Woesearchaeota archaeon]MBT4716915.1 sodium-dependent transporter [Candidatus Woesearchaeota archaeon]MBT7105367.1 sodium-dependent transporter [Candidatus Woesearchaeota archaeon]
MRDRWATRTMFLFAAIGSAVGLGNVWRFPYLTYEFGGGAFLIPYLIALFVLGIPLLILEFAIGQKLQKGAIDAFKSVHGRLRGVGFMAIASGFMVVIYYAAVMAWALVYFLRSFSARLPWAEDAKGYFFGNVLQLSDGIGQVGGINWMLLAALAVVWILIYFCVWKGVKSAGKVVMITMPLPIILLIALFIRGITLDGALTGIFYYLKPNFAALLSTEIWLAAASQIFFTLSLGFGIMIAYSSYKKETQDIAKDAYVTAFANSAISIFSGFVVFAVLGYMAFSTGVGVPDVVASGPGLVFVVFPQALALMPWAWFFASLFFLTLLMLGIDSAFSLVESVNTVIADKAKNAVKHKIAFVVCLVSFLLGIIFTTNAGLYFLDVVDHFITNFGLVLAGIFECLAIGWIYGAERLRTYINKVSEWKVGPWWSVAIKYVIPIILTILVVVQFIKEIGANYEGYPTWAIGIGWLTVVIPLVVAAILAFRPARTKIRL